jgi:hypothetical protein
LRNRSAPEAFDFSGVRRERAGGQLDLAVDVRGDAVDGADEGTASAADHCRNGFFDSCLKAI